MRPIARFLLLCLALSPLVPAGAATVEGLYRVREPLPQGQEDARQEALRRAFDTLVLRLTGQPDAAGRAGLAALRQDPQQLISRFGFDSDSVQVEFDPAAVQQQLRQAGLALWGAERPELLAWWLLQGPADTRLIGDGQESAAVLKAAAQHRGLPLRLPLADLGEQLAVTPESLGEPAMLEEASARYDADARLQVHAVDGGGVWQADWHLVLGERSTQGRSNADSLAALADTVMREAHAWLARQYTGESGVAEPVVLQITDVDVARFARIDRLLKGLGGQLVAVEGDRLTYRLQADPAQLRAQLALARLVEQPVEPEPAPIDASVTPDDPDAAAPSPAPDALHLRFGW